MRSIFITGCNRGIGLGLVKTLVDQKNPPEWIFATCRKPDQAAELQKIAARNKNLHIIPLDVTDFGAYKNVIDNISGILKDGLNVLVNNAGVPGKYARMGFLKPEHMIDTFTVNTVAPVMLTKACIPLLKQSATVNEQKPLGPDRAVVINISSILGSIGENKEGGYYTYRASKTALNAITKSLSIDLKPMNILVTCLHPGWVKTEMGGPKAPMSVEESSQAIINFLFNLSKKHNGGYYSYDGSEIPW